ncbi:MAG: cohesin domain-containing protein, partial [Candidatus Marinimicrobia bacterium]|nr:cohesin domain-containing protein [Candidatus Neomarinimicrobiota bacterium]
MKSLSFSLLIILVMVFAGSCEQPDPPIFENPIDTTTIPGVDPPLNPALVIFVDTDNVTVGSTVKISVHARVVEQLSGVHIQLNYDNQKMQYLSVTLGELFSASEDSWIFDEDDGGQGVLDIYTSYLNPNNVDISGTGQIVELRFEAVATGDAIFSFDEQESQFVDAEDVEIEILEFVGGVVHV